MKMIQGKVPLILTALFTLSLLVIPFFTFPALGSTGLVFPVVMVGGYLFWLFLETKVMTLKEIKKDKTVRDRGTTELYGLARLIVVVLSLVTVSSGQVSPYRLAAGGLLFAAGVFLRLYSIRTLGVFYSHRVRLVSEHKIIDFGPYRFVRHPSYAGMIMAHLGWVLCFFSIYSFLAYVFLLIPAVVMRILVEEESLFELDGYREFASRRKRLVPFLW
ncbi:MAG: isoprenylcysteine carboxylmethyltransferase family protein [Hungatella sp.]|jgi:protein-S-isoprenylcysteine O-methyltransferase Ste14|nr:isoprenylcysteine carboxylmethyltransferase family protein [Hungatella sp.]